jgi:hypothetical protein
MLPGHGSAGSWLKRDHCRGAPVDALRLSNFLLSFASLRALIKAFETVVDTAWQAVGRSIRLSNDSR